MQGIKRAANMIKKNQAEAKEYILMAHELKDVDKAEADLCKDAAVQHMAMVNGWHARVKKLIADYDASGQNHPVAEGMRMRWADDHAELMREAAEIQGMIAAYK